MTKSALPDRTSFAFKGVYLDAAFTHPVGSFAVLASQRYMESRHATPQAVGPRGNPRKAAVERFARLINCDAGDIAVVPSTLDGENLICTAIGVGPGAGVVTDAGHYDASLVLYAEHAKRGAPVSVVRLKDGRIDPADFRKAITRQTRLVAVSLVSSQTGFTHDLAELCEIAHAKGALVYADIVQAAGAMPVDVRASGVDFACCGTYKWLMGDFGTAFLYVRPDRLDELKRPHVGWRQVRRQASHDLPFDPTGPAIGDYELAQTAAGLFETSTPAWGALATVVASLDYIEALGVEAICRHRQDLIENLRSQLSSAGFTALTPRGSPGPVLVYAVRDAQARFGQPLRQAGVAISVYPHRIRISPSVYNTQGDMDQLAQILRA